MSRRLRATATTATVVALLGGYLAADAHDVVPGLLTVAPPHPQPNPFPEAPGAQPGPEPSPVLLPLSDDAAAPSASEVGRLVQSLVDDPRLGERVGVLVVDAESGEVLGAAAPDEQFTPASTQKILTAVAALTELDPDSTLDTRAVLTADDRVVLVGGGDMMLAAGYGNPDEVNGRAGLADLADQVIARLQVTGTSTVRLSVDDTLFTGAPVSPAVTPNAADMGHVGPVAALAVDRAMQEPGSWGPRWPDPALQAARTFGTLLAERGVHVTGDPTRTTSPVPETARELGRVSSATIREISGWTMQRSDNTITEVLGRLVALAQGRPGTNEGATSAVRAAVERLGVDLTGAHLADLSGLGRGSLLSPRQLVEVVLLMVDPEHPHLRDAASDLPIANLTGTLANRFAQASPARGVLRAKTGSLPTVRGLTGTVLTQDDRLLAFSLHVDAVETGATHGAQMIFDDFAGRLAALGSAATVGR